MGVVMRELKLMIEERERIAIRVIEEA